MRDEASHPISVQSPSNFGKLIFLNLFFLTFLLVFSQASAHSPQITTAQLNSQSVGETAVINGTSTSIYLPLIRKPHDTYYVSKNGNNTTGQSWASAWNELDQIDWSVIGPGNTIVLDGGSSQMTYRTTLLLENISGSSENPITIRLSTEDGRDGQAVFFGGRSTLLPYCNQANYTFQENGVNSYGVFIENSSHIVIDGSKRSGIYIYGNNINGMRFNFNTSHFTVRNLEVYDNGFAERSGSTWVPNSAGIRIAGHNHLFEKMIVHDNGQDAFQSGAGQSPNFNINNLDNLTIRESWLYNGRQHPTVNESANYCSHTDGLQVNRGGNVENVTIEQTIIGPGFTNGVILGQTLTSNGAQASLHNVTLRDVLFMKAADNSIRGYVDTNPTGWVVDNVTSHCPQTKGHCIYLEGNNHTVTDSIFVYAAVTFPDGLDTSSNNCQYEASGVVIGTEANPQFANVNDNNMFSLDNYAVSGSSACSGKGTSITTVNQLLSLIDN